MKLRLALVVLAGALCGCDGPAVEAAAQASGAAMPAPRWAVRCVQMLRWVCAGALQ